MMCGRARRARCSNASGSRKNSVTHEQVLGEEIGFLGVLPEDVEVLVQGCRAAQQDAATQPAEHRAALVVAEVMSRGALKHLGDPIEGGLELFVRGGLHPYRRRNRSHNPNAPFGYSFCVLQQLRRYLLGRQDVIDQSGIDGAPRHVVVLRGVRTLGEGESAVVLDRSQTDGAIRAGTREEDADGTLALVLGERPQKGVDLPVPFRVGGGHLERTAGDSERRSRCDDIDVVGLRRDAVLGLDDRHRGSPSEDLRQHAGMLRGEVLDHHVGEAAALGHMREELFERLQAACGRADAHDQRAAKLGRALHLWWRAHLL